MMHHVLFKGEKFKCRFAAGPFLEIGIFEISSFSLHYNGIH